VKTINKVYDGDDDDDTVSNFWHTKKRLLVV